MGWLSIARAFIGTSRAGRAIKKLPLSGGTPTTLVSSLIDPAELVVDATHAYWTDPTEGAIMRVSVDGGPAEVVAVGQAVPHKITRDASGIYWVNRGSVGQPASVMKATDAGCTPITLAAQLRGARAIALTADRVYWSVPSTSDGAGGSVPGSILSVAK